jgi:hypothetical protein
MKKIYTMLLTLLGLLYSGQVMAVLCQMDGNGNSPTCSCAANPDTLRQSTSPDVCLCTGSQWNWTADFSGCKCTTGSSSPWVQYLIGHDTRNLYNTTTCALSSVEYRCQAGYYGTSISGTSGCTKCPCIGTSCGNVAAGNGNTAANCYLSACGSTSYNDTTGTFRFGSYTGTNQCHNNDSVGTACP